MDYTAVACPNCGANVKIEKDRVEGYCTYCGSQISLKEVINDNYKFKKLLKLIRKEIKNNRYKSDEFRDMLNDAMRLNPDNKEIYNLQKFKIWNAIIEDHKLIKHTSNEKTLVVPNFIYTIKSGAFVTCNKLTNITIPKSVTEMGIGVFANRRDALVIHTDAGTCAAKYAIINSIRLNILKENSYWSNVEKTCKKIRNIQNKIIESKLNGVEKIKSHYSYLYSEAYEKGPVYRKKSGRHTLLALPCLIVMIIFLINNKVIWCILALLLFVFCMIKSLKYKKCYKNSKMLLKRINSINYADIFDWNNTFNNSFIYFYIQNSNHLGFRIWNYSNTQIRSEYTYLKNTLKRLEKLNPDKLRKIKSIEDTSEISYDLHPVITVDNKLAEKYLNLALYNYNETNNNNRNYFVIHNTIDSNKTDEINSFTGQKTTMWDGVIQIYDEMLMAKEGVLYINNSYVPSEKPKIDIYFMDKESYVRQCGTRAEVFLTLARFMPILGNDLIVIYKARQYNAETFLQFM